MERKNITKYILFIFLSSFLLYASFELYKIIKGPELTILSPKDGETLSSPNYDLTGNAKRISYISLNDRQIFTDIQGNFEEKLIALPGHNIITVRVSDRYERIIEKKIRIYRTPQESDSFKIKENTASSTATTTSNN